MKKKSKQMLGIAIPLAFIIISISYNEFIKSHTFILSGESDFKHEQIQPVNGTVKVSGNIDTDVIFIEVESGLKYTIGYITQGMAESISLECGRWYTVEGAGELTIRPVNVRIE